MKNQSDAALELLNLRDGIERLERRIGNGTGSLRQREYIDGTFGWMLEFNAIGINSYSIGPYRTLRELLLYIKDK